MLSYYSDGSHTESFGVCVVFFFVSHLTAFYLKQETRVTVRSGYRVSQTTEENNKHTDSKPLESEKGNVASTKTKSIIFP